MIHRRRLLFGVTAAAVSGCAVSPGGRSLDAQGHYCFRPGRSTQRICTPAVVPGPDVEAEALRFQPRPDRLTLVIVRKRMADVRHVIALQVDGQRAAETVPDSFVVLHLPAGVHRLAFEVAGQVHTLELGGQAGELRLAEIVGGVYAWGSRYAWSTDDDAGARSRAAGSRLIAVVDRGP